MDTKGFTSDALEEELLASEPVIAQARYRQMAVLRELDRRQAVLRDGYRSLVEWVTGRIDVAPETGRNLISTGRRLEELPDVDEAAIAGAIGFDIAGIRRLAARRRRADRSRRGHHRNPPPRAAQPGSRGTEPECSGENRRARTTKMRTAPNPARES